MREIKFRYRFKILETGEIITIYRTIYDIEENDFGRDDVNPDSEILSRDQWTGRVDKNGKEIYEGDVLKDGDGGKFVVKWDELHDCCINAVGFQLKNDDTYASYDECEVIGNMNSNPELLKV